jgi:hypothetical protein
MCNAWGAKSIMVHDQEYSTQFNLQSYLQILIPNTFIYSLHTMFLKN